MTAPDENELALVMSGGGARAAYQVGFLLTVAQRLPELELPIITGVSAGAINAGYLAARREGLQQSLERLAELWSTLETRQVFRTGNLGLWTHVVRWGASLISGGHLTKKPRGLVNTAPLADLLGSLLEADGGGFLPGVERNLERGVLRAAAITASSYSTGQSVTFVQGRDIQGWDRAHRTSQSCRLKVAHIMASAALPLFFPATEIDGHWYGDGGMRLTAPFSPAIHLGARRILAISTRYGATREEAERPVVSGYPPPAQVAGQLLNSIFLDQFDGDALRIERVNELLEHVPAEERGELHPIRLMVLRPSLDLGRLSNEYEPKLDRSFRFLTRGIGTRETRSNDLLSLVMFQPDYLERLIRLGITDAETQWERVATFLAG